jgi:hypothetical protein
MLNLLPKNICKLLNFQQDTQRKQPPNRRKSAKSGRPGANPTIASYNASVENYYNPTGSLARFENINILFYFRKTH